MQVHYQRFQVNDKVISIETELNKSNGIHFVLLQDVQDVVPEAVRFEIDGKPVRFLSDDFGNRFEPLRVAWHRDVVMDIVLSSPDSSSLPSTKPLTHALAPEYKEKIPPTFNPTFGYYKPHHGSQHFAARAVSPPVDDWREYLQQQAIRMAILVVISTITILLNKTVYGQLRHADFPGVIYWHVVYIALFILSLVWFLMLVVLVVEVVWYLIRTPLAAKRSMYQRLFDF
ncbi:hypothetical protein BG003_001053 [Podila horticola]|nr:hypothetical protein BG003_001053 [Podila horticola]